MINDRFSGQLRQHLIETADERVAEGQLASIVDRVAVTAQRRTLVARLPWFSGGAGSASVSQLRWALLVASALLGVTIAGAILVGGSTPPVDESTVAPTLLPTQAPSPTPDAYPNCIQFDAHETYTALAGSMSLTVDVPGTLEEPWIGERDHFDLLQAACADWRGSSKIDAGEVTQIDTSACAGAKAAVETYAEAVAAVSTAKGIDVVAQTDVTLGGYPGTRFDIVIPEAANACPDQQIPLVDSVNPFDPGLDITLYLIDVDGKTLALALFMPSSWSPERTAKVDDILASLQIDASPPERTSQGIRNCSEADNVFEATGRYTGPAGSLSVTVDVPGNPDDPWLGLVGRFSLRSLKSACTDFGRSGGWLEASEVTQVETEVCAGAGVPVNSFDDALAAISAAKGIEVDKQTDVTLGGLPGTRFDIRMDPDPNACPEDQVPLVDGVIPFEPGARYPLYLIDVDGKPLAIALYQTDIWRPEVRVQVDEILASLQVDPPEPSTSDSGSPDCVEFRARSSYTAPEGTLSLTVGVPGTPTEPWNGDRSRFSLLKASCTDWSGPGAIDAGVVTRVDSGDCEGLFIDTTDEAIAAVSTAKGIDVVAQTEVTLGRHPGAQFDISLPEDATVCATNVVNGVDPFEPGLNVRLYLLDVDSKTLVLALYGYPDWSPDVKADVDEILASLQIEATTD